MSYQKRLLFLNFIDAFIVAAAVVLAYLLRFDFQVQVKYFIFLPYVISAQIAIILVVFNRANMYRRVWQYASIGELMAIVKGVTIAQAGFFLVYLVVHNVLPNVVVPRSIFPLSWLFIIAGVGGARLYWRLFRDSYLKPNLRTDRRRTLIIGAGEAGVLIAKELKLSPHSELYPVAFIDDDRTKWHLEVIGMRVLGGRDKIAEVVSRHDIEKIIIALPSAAKSEIAKIIAICKETGANTKLLPRVSDLTTSRVTVNMIREVSVEDLLGRDPVELDLAGIANYITDKVVLVTGAGGSIGSELCRQVVPFHPAKLMLLGRGENSIYEIEMELRKKFPGLSLETIIADIKDASRLREIFKKYRPALVFHAAAHKHVPLMERNPCEAVKNNIMGTKNVADCAHEFGATHFVMISTDKAVNPTSIMGASKRVAEMYIQLIGKTGGTKFVAVRFGNVLGSRGSVIPLFKRQIRDGGPVTVTHPDMVRYFMTIPEAVQLVIQAGAFASGGEIFILDMGQPVKIVDLACDLIRLSGLEPDHDIKIAFTGIRPGEKLYEEMLTNEEGITATKHNRIFVGKPTAYPAEQLHLMLEQLATVAVKKSATNLAETIKDLLKQIIPTCDFSSSIMPAFDEAQVIDAGLRQVQAEIASTK